jgi:hypothetical protein
MTRHEYKMKFASSIVIGLLGWSTASASSSASSSTSTSQLQLQRKIEDTAQSCDPCLGGGDDLTISVVVDESCQELLDETRSLLLGSDDCKNAQLRNYQNQCCGSSPLSHSPCSLCPDGGTFDATKVVPNMFEPNGPSTTCADLNIDESFLDYLFEEGECSDTLLQRSASWCGCAESERQCYLCPDGSRPPNPALVDPVYYGWNCDAFDFVSSYLSESECYDLAINMFEFDAPSYCGCPDSPIPQVCRLCPEGQEIVRPHYVLGNGEFTCQQLALSTRYIPSEEPCQRVKTTYHGKGYVEYCCGTVRSGDVTFKAYSLSTTVIMLFTTIFLVTVSTAIAV